MLYIILSEVLSSRLKPLLAEFISLEQAAFVPGRSILDNALAAFEIIHYMKCKSQGCIGDVVLKLDIIKKSFDRVDWLSDVMSKVGFSNQ